MVQPARLTLIGYWDGPETAGSWPHVQDFVDPDWDRDDREFIASYLTMGLVARTYMGYSKCRICGKADNGDMELTDGTYVWPNGLSHYVIEHSVRLPGSFVDHAYATIEAIEEAERDTKQWAQAALPPHGASIREQHFDAE